MTPEELVKSLKTFDAKFLGYRCDTSSFDSLSEINELVTVWKMVLNEFELCGTCFTIRDEDDFSELGGEIQFMTPEAIVDEVTNAYPGIVVSTMGYLPIAACLEGSGDYYYLKKDSKNFNVYRVLHECLDSDLSVDPEKIEHINSLQLIIEKSNSYK